MLTDDEKAMLEMAEATFGLTVFPGKSIEARLIAVVFNLANVVEALRRERTEARK